MILSLLDFLNPTGLNNTLFYLFFTIFASYTAALIVSRCFPKNRTVLLFLSLPLLVSIVNISLYSYEQVCAAMPDYNTFTMFLLANLLLVIGGVFHNFQVKYMLVSNLISAPLHIGFFYFYSHHNLVASILTALFNPILSYSMLLGFVYFTVSHFLT